MTQIFTKMHGCGNDFVIMYQPKTIDPEYVVDLSNRYTGVGFDQLLVLHHHHNDFVMRVFNQDGSEAMNCGNGLRCMAQFIHQRWMLTTFSIQCGGLSYLAKIESGAPFVLMPKPSVMDEVGEHTFVVLGNQHLIVWSQGHHESSLLALSLRFDANIHQVAVENNKMSLIPFERGVGLTQACGSGAVAAYWAAKHRRYVIQEVSMPGGTLFLNDDDDGLCQSGPTATVFEGQL